MGIMCSARACSPAYSEEPQDLLRIALTALLGVQGLQETRLRPGQHLSRRIHGPSTPWKETTCPAPWCLCTCWTHNPSTHSKSSSAALTWCLRTNPVSRVSHRQCIVAPEGQGSEAGLQEIQLWGVQPENWQPFIWNMKQAVPVLETEQLDVSSF